MTPGVVFIDLENVGLEFYKRYGRPFDPQQLMDVAQRFCSPIFVARAYADFASKPILSESRRLLRPAGIEDVDVPSRHQGGRVKNYVDFHMLWDICLTLWDRQDAETFVIATGDDHFTDVSARLKNRFGKRVVVCAVPGSYSQSLRLSASEFIELEGGEEIDRRPVSSGEAGGEDGRALFSFFLELYRRKREEGLYVSEKYLLDLASRDLGVSRARVQHAFRALHDHGLILKELRETPHGPRVVVLPAADHPEVVRAQGESRWAGGWG